MQGWEPLRVSPTTNGSTSVHAVPELALLLVIDHVLIVTDVETKQPNLKPKSGLPASQPWVSPQDDVDIESSSLPSDFHSPRPVSWTSIATGCAGPGWCLPLEGEFVDHALSSPSRLHFLWVESPTVVCCLFSMNLCTTQNDDAPQSKPRSSRKLVVFSGGSAANNLVDVFNEVIDNHLCSLTFIIPISDNGGSSSELIRVFGGPGIGDVRSKHPSRPLNIVSYRCTMVSRISASSASD